MIVGVCFYVRIGYQAPTKASRFEPYGPLTLLVSHGLRAKGFSIYPAVRLISERPVIFHCKTQQNINHYLF